MEINKLKIVNFRNILSAEIVPHKNMNVFLGENAQGKTSILEALWLFSGAKSFRGAKDSETVNFNNKTATLCCDFSSHGTEKQAKIEIEQRRSAELFNKKLKTPTNLSEYFHAVVFSPADLNLIEGDGAARRRFADVAIGFLSPKYITMLKKYNRATMQRNALLKKIRDGEAAADLLEPFEKEMAVSSAEIIKHRAKYVKRLNEEAPKIYAGISENREKMEVKYAVHEYENITANEMLNILKESRSRDIPAGSTTVGPRFDDIEVLIDGKAAKTFGSQGQKRSAALCLKLAEAEILKTVTNEEPIVLLDDVMSELDLGRQRFILQKLKNRQVFITACDPSNLSELLSGKVFNVKGGNVCI